ncbi:MAG: hypothetical protein LBU67_04590 [Oscillospiraceae bacterium]|jgi:hypothetical protein|nr:hypothetical protein [Oscillospiraceae bacterium]
MIEIDPLLLFISIHDSVSKVIKSATNIETMLANKPQSTMKRIDGSIAGPVRTVTLSKPQVPGGMPAQG